jgi:hypothetical protein
MSHHDGEDQGEAASIDAIDTSGRWFWFLGTLVQIRGPWCPWSDAMSLKNRSGTKMNDFFVRHVATIALVCLSLQWFGLYMFCFLSPNIHLLYMNVSINAHALIWAAVKTLCVWSLFPIIQIFPSTKIPKLFVLGKFKLVNLILVWPPLGSNLKIKVPFEGSTPE